MGLLAFIAALFARRAALIAGAIANAYVLSRLLHTGPVAFGFLVLLAYDVLDMVLTQIKGLEPDKQAGIRATVRLYAWTTREMNHGQREALAHMVQRVLAGKSIGPVIELVDQCPPGPLRAQLVQSLRNLRIEILPPGAAAPTRARPPVPPPGGHHA